MMSLSDVSAMLEVPMSGSNVDITAVATDTRTLSGGELFVALRGENHDAHAFIDQAASAGASSVMVSEDGSYPLPNVQVVDTTIGLGSLAAAWRRTFQLPVVGVTGSNGKTTVKQMTGAIFAQAYRTGVVSSGNFNNHIGLPLSVLRLREEDEYAVFEMGMSNPGEIDYLTRIAAPTVAVVTNAAEAHLQGLGTVHAVARAKGEIFGGMNMDGVAVLNADDEFADLWRQLAGTRKCLRFAVEADADVTCAYTLRPDGSDLTVRTPEGSFETSVSLPGLHNVKNALAATAAAVGAGIALDSISKGLAGFTQASGRLESQDLGHGNVLINDAYNANPASVRAAVDVLRLGAKRTLLVLGDMAELGVDAAEHHHHTGQYAKDAGIDGLIGLGELSRVTVSGFGSGARHCTEIQDVIDAVNAQLEAGDVTVLVKGSRSMRMERVVAAVQSSARGESTC